MTKCMKFRSIGQFRDAVKQIKLQESYDGKDEEGNPKYKKVFNYPTVVFRGTVKAHGTNASFRQEYPEDDILFQSRERIIDPLSDNAGFASNFWPHRQAIKELFLKIRFAYQKDQLNWPSGRIIVYGEWAGGNIQKSVALAGTPKLFYVFSIKIVTESGNDFVYFPHCSVFSEIFNQPIVKDVQSISVGGEFIVSVDLNSPEIAQNQIVEMVDAVEKCCPITKTHGVEGIGEGIVFVGEAPYSDIMFKAKGELHSVTKVRTVASVDIERVNSVKELVDMIVTENRMQQIFDNATDLGIELSRPGTGSFIKAVMSDCMKEEMDTILENGITTKEFANVAQRVIVQFFHQLV
jgi:hypothetical protein